MATAIKNKKKNKKLDAVVIETITKGPTFGDEKLLHAYDL
jgi:hypothetical protein